MLPRRASPSHAGVPTCRGPCRGRGASNAARRGRARLQMAPEAGGQQFAIAANRFGLGARPQDRLGPLPRAMVLDSIAAYRPRPPALAALEPSEVLAGQIGRAHV